MGRGSGGNVGRTPQQQNSTIKSATKNTPVTNARDRSNNNKSDDVLTNNSITMTRAKRTPKPNRKYINDEVITMRSKISSSRSNSPDSEDIDDDDDDIDIVLNKKFSSSKATGKDSDSEIGRGRGNLRKKAITPTVNIKPISVTKPMQNTIPTPNRKIYEMRDLTARAKEPNTPIMVKRTMVQQESVNRNSRISVLPKKRTPKNDDIDFEMPSNDDDADDDEDFEEEKTPRVVRRTRQVGSLNNNVIKMSQPVRQISRIATSTTIGNTSITPTMARNSTITTTSSNLKMNTVAATNIVKKSVVNRPVQVTPHFKLTETSATNKSNSVHSFTIVNINDIIKKGPEAPLKKRKLLDSNTPEVPDNKRKRFAEAIEKSRDKHNSSMDEDLDLDMDLDDDDVELIEVKENKKSGGLNRNTTNSRRKTQHTTILTDDFETKIKTNQLHKSTLAQQSLNNNNNGKFKENDKKYEVMQPQTKNLTSSKPPPRILNSMLGRRPTTKHSDVVGEFDIKHSKSSSPVIEMKPISDGLSATKSSHTNNSSLTKENIIKTYKGSNLVNQQRKLESLMDSKPKVVYEEQDGKRVKKITCFETWYVINIPNIDVPIQKPFVNVSLIKIGNEAKQILLPSNRWTYRITLSKLKNEHTNEIYTGEVQDDHIKESEKHLYEPTNIMFRRRKTHVSLNMQYDRAIIFKNSSYFLNIDGKSVKLLGSPQTINNFTEVETLLQIVDDISLVNSCVEPTNYGS